jgi:hypothetical protein
MEKFREIEVDLQNAIEEANRIPTLFDYYLEERNEYHKTLEDDMFTQRDKLQKELSTLNKLNQQNLEKRQLLQQKLDKIEEMFNDETLNKYYYGMSYEFGIDEFKKDIFKIIKGGKKNERNN